MDSKNTKNIIIAILALTTIAGGVYSWQQRGQVKDRDAQIVRLTAAAKSSARRAQRPEGDAQQRSPAPDNPGAGAGRSSQPPNADAFRALMQSPKAMQLMASQQRGNIETRYAPLFKSLNLPPDQLAKFKDLLIDKQNAARDVITVARQEGITDRTEIQQLIQQAQADVDTSIASLIGTDKLAQYQNFDQTAPQRSVVSEVGQRLSYTDPLSPAQSEQLVSLLAQYAPARDDGNSSRPPSRISITGQVIDAAQTFLTPTQLDALRQMQAEQTDHEQLHQLMRDSGGGGGPSGGGGPPGSGKSKGRRPPGR